MYIICNFIYKIPPSRPKETGMVTLIKYSQSGDIDQCMGGDEG